MGWTTSAYIAAVAAGMTLAWGALSLIWLAMVVSQRGAAWRSWTEKRVFSIAVLFVVLATWTAARTLGTDEVLGINVENVIVCQNNVDKCTHIDVLTHARIFLLFFLFGLVRRATSSTKKAFALLDWGIAVTSFLTVMVEDRRAQVAGLILACLLHLHYVIVWIYNILTRPTPAVYDRLPTTTVPSSKDSDDGMAAGEDGGILSSLLPGAPMYGRRDEFGNVVVYEGTGVDNRGYWQSGGMTQHNDVYVNVSRKKRNSNSVASIKKRLSKTAYDTKKFFSELCLCDMVFFLLRVYWIVILVLFTLLTEAESTPEIVTVVVLEGLIIFTQGYRLITGVGYW